MIFFTRGNFFAGTLTLVGMCLFPTLIGFLNTRNVLELPVIVTFDPLLVIVVMALSCFMMDGHSQMTQERLSR